MKKNIRTLLAALMLIVLTGAFLTGCANPQTEQPSELPSSDVIETPSSSPVPTTEPTEPEESEPPETINVRGTWSYSHSTEGEEESPLSIYEFSVSPPHLEIREDNTITAYFYESVREGKLVQSSANSYTVTDISVIAEGSQYHEDLDDFLRYDPESGALRYTLSIANVHHYFILAAD